MISELGKSRKRYRKQKHEGTSERATEGGNKMFS